MTSPDAGAKVVAETWMHVLAGADVWEAIRRDSDGRRGNSAAERDADLCRIQEEHARRGYLGAQIVQSVYGWSVRYDSGIQNFGIIAGPRLGSIDGTLADAERFAREWVAQDSARRYAWMRDAS